MLALLSKALLVLMLVLLLPTGLVFASQDAVPGDRTYPVKRGLENVIVTLASLHPSTRAFFKADMAGRRYKEAVALVQRGDVNSASSLVELVAQTQAAAKDINRIDDPVAKKQLVQNLSKQIDDYKKGLTALESTAPPATVAVAPPSLQSAPQVVQPTQVAQQPLQQVQPIQQPVQPTQPVSRATSPSPAPVTFTQPTLPAQLNTVVPLPSSPPPPSLPAAPSGSIRGTIDDLEVIGEELRNLSKGIDDDNGKDKEDKGGKGRNNKDSGKPKKKFDK